MFPELRSCSTLLIKSKIQFIVGRTRRNPDNCSGRTPVDSNQHCRRCLIIYFINVPTHLLRLIGRKDSIWSGDFPGIRRGTTLVSYQQAGMVSSLQLNILRRARLAFELRLARASHVTQSNPRLGFLRPPSSSSHNENLTSNFLGALHTFCNLPLSSGSVRNKFVSWKRPCALSLSFFCDSSVWAVWTIVWTN